MLHQDRLFPPLDTTPNPSLLWPPSKSVRLAEAFVSVPMLKKIAAFLVSATIAL